MIIKVDTREHELLGKIKNLVLFTPSFKDMKVVTETLPIGDIIISDEKEEKLIIERKCINDLLSSIKDGRYEEQSYRLNGLNNHNHNIYYLIEGDVNRMMNRFKDNVIEKQTIYSAIFSLNYYKGFSVMRTFTIDETALFICNTAYKLKKSDKLPFYKNKQNNENVKVENMNNDENVDIETITEMNDKKNNMDEPEKESSDKDYISVVKKVKKENITEDNIGEIMLCQIPGISSVTAIAIMNKFKTIPNLIKEIDTDGSCLKDISYTNAKGQTRKINKTSITNIVKFLFRK
jgi:crossover junction endonuclease MUS81